ncbi:BTAD domain-containing putative transcriptional regulator [Rubrivivax sp. RP6-9]|uniref:BTAD domain-containing putative transcriptional regulator n=1 Tax=Rubrivivax sp. RP6-9 TaxID=3415750 RepID=UPI003CC5EFA0
MPSFLLYQTEERMTLPIEPPSPPAAQLEVGAELRLARPDGTAYTVAGNAAALLAMAALEGPVERQRAARLLWPDSPTAQARNNLRTLVHRINQRFGAELLVGTERVAIDPARVRVVTPDADALLAVVEAGRTQPCVLLAQAAVETRPSDGLLAWLDAARQRLRRQQLAALSTALEAALDQGQRARATAIARAGVQLEPLSEHWHRRLMETLARCGDRAAALAAYEDCRVQLRRHLGVLPDAQTRAAQLRILQDQAQEAPQAGAVEPRAAGAARVPTPGTEEAGLPLVEREAALSEVRAALAQGLHVALQGEAGVGKSRLLHQIVEPARPGTPCADVERVVIHPGAHGEPYAALAQLLLEVQSRRTVRLAVPDQVELARLAPQAFAGVQPSQAGLSAPRLIAALRRWTGQLAAAGLRHLVLDDVHHADAASQAAIAALLVPAEGPAQPALLLAFRSDEIAAVLAEALVNAQVARQARSITLPRLSLHGVQALLRALQAPSDDAQAAHWLQRTGGNPLFVIALAQHARERERSPGTCESAGTDAALANLDALLRLRLEGCRATARQLAAVAAVAAQDFSVELAAAVLGQPPLALMPAWTELQQRGLFADHGLAHDLVRDAALDALPGAIRKSLHGQVAGFLEGLGLRGAEVLVHWLAADDPDRALPHAVHQIHAVDAMGLPTMRLEVELIGLLERASDDVLLDNLWHTAELGGGLRTEVWPAEVWPRMAALVARVARLPARATTAAWIAYETSRVLVERDDDAATAYSTLAAAAAAMPEEGMERARVEETLTYHADDLALPLAPHIERAQRAVSALADRSWHNRLITAIDRLQAWVRPVEALLLHAARMRAARRRGDLAAAAEFRFQVAMALREMGYNRRAMRHFMQDVKSLPHLCHVADARYAPSQVGICALGAGHFQCALDCLAVKDNWHGAMGPVVSCIVLLRLGRWEPLRQQLALVGPLSGMRISVLISCLACARSELDRHDGKDPAQAYREALAVMESAGIGPLPREGMRWELAVLTRPAPERIAMGTRLLDAIAAAKPRFPRPTQLVLQLAEAHFEAGSGDCRALALEAGRALRRGRLSYRDSMPEAMLRCTRLLQGSDPAEAASLLHAARRWVLQSLPHVPPDARDSYAALPAHRRLLGDDAGLAQALAQRKTGQPF